MRTRTAVLLVLITSAAAALAAGCGRTAATGQGGGRLSVVATTTQLGDLARAVGGDRTSVVTLLRPNADPHEYEPKPSDAQAIAGADVVLRSGGEVDAWMDELIHEAGGSARVVNVKDAVGANGDDPHWWQDPRNGAKAVDVIRDAFAKADAGGRAAYTAAAARERGRIERLDAAIAACIDTLPAGSRRLVTNHDAFGYFARRYGIEILGSIIPALSSAAQPSAGDVRRLVAAIRREHVRTIFPEAALNQRLERAVARDAGAKVGPALYADTLGPKGSDGATYPAALRHDAQAIATGLGAHCTIAAP